MKKLAIVILILISVSTKAQTSVNHPFPESSLTKKSFYKHLKTKINFLTDSAFLKSSDSNSGDDLFFQKKKFWNENKLQYPNSFVQYAVLFKFGKYINAFYVSKNKKPNPQTIIDGHGKIHPNLIFPPVVLSKAEISETLSFVNDTLNYQYYEGILRPNKYAGIIYFDKDLNVVGHLTICEDHMEVRPGIPTTLFTQTGALRENSRARLKALISKYETVHE